MDFNFTQWLESLNPFTVASNAVDYVSTTYNQLTDSAKAKVREWNAAIEKVRTTPVPNDAELAQWRADILSRADTIKRMILALVSDQTAKDMGLGFPPAAVVAGGVAITGILGYITAQMVDVSKYFSRMNYIKATAQKLIEQKVPVEVAYKKATELANEAGETKDETFLGIKIKHIGMGFIALGVLGFIWNRNK